MTLLVATEDELSEKVALKLIRQVRGSEEGVECVRRNGFGFLKSNIKKYREVAERAPVFILTDLDQDACAPCKRKMWLRQVSSHTSFLFRIVVREIETWLLADREAMAAFLKVSLAKIERNSESIADPKRYLLKLAQMSPKGLRTDLLPERGRRASQGFGYNERLGEFVNEKWSSQRASENSDSLRRALTRLNECFLRPENRFSSPSKAGS